MRKSPILLKHIQCYKIRWFNVANTKAQKVFFPVGKWHYIHLTNLFMLLHLEVIGCGAVNDSFYLLKKLP